MEAVLDYAFKLTATPHAMAEIGIERLRKDNLADEDILTVNRIALGLRVAFTVDEVEGYEY